MKRAPVKSVTLSPEQIAAIRTTVFQVVESNLDTAFYLLDVALEKEMGAWYLRIYVDKPDYSISLSDCEQISRSLDERIEGVKLLQDLPYNLEVSSPGLFRALKEEREFSFYKGRSVRIVREEPQATVSKNRRLKLPVIEHELLAGTLDSYDAASSAVTVRKPDQQLETLILEADSQVFLNPNIRFPEAEEAALEENSPLDSTDLLEEKPQ
jgi:ribosome maturation factor RimP